MLFLLPLLLALAPAPDPSLSPADVVKLQLAALQHNDSPSTDSGIRLAFTFASPGNQAATGPVDRFIQLVKNPLYLPLLNHRAATLLPLHIEAGRAEQRVTLIDSQGHPATYLFELTRQPAGLHKGCWLTDGVSRLPDDPRKTMTA